MPLMHLRPRLASPYNAHGINGSSLCELYLQITRHALNLRSGQRYGSFGHRYPSMLAPACQAAKR